MNYKLYIIKYENLIISSKKEAPNIDASFWNYKNLADLLVTKPYGLIR